MTLPTLASPKVLAVPQKGHPWRSAFESWFTLMPANSARAYQLAWKSLLAHTGKNPWEIERADVAGWVECMTREGRSASTIQQRLAGVSSFFQFLNDSCGIKSDNPASGKSLRPKRGRYEGARYLDVDHVQMLLAAIPGGTPQGSRDLALYLAYLFTGRRNTEIRSLKWGDIEQDHFRIYYRWTGKGKSRRDELPRPVFKAITRHLEITGRDKTIQPDDYIFIPLTNNATRLPNVGAQTSTAGQQPISMHEVGQLLKKYCRMAGLAPMRVHDLRHTAAMLRRAAGDDVEKVSDFLNHSNIAITQTYLHGIEGRVDDSWQTVEKMLGIS